MLSLLFSFNFLKKKVFNQFRIDKESLSQPSCIDRPSLVLEMCRSHWPVSPATRVGKSAAPVVGPLYISQIPH